MKLPILIISLLMVALPARSATLFESYTFDNLNLNIPDGDPAGVVNRQTVLSDIYSISEVTVGMKITGSSPFNGDLYAYLQFGSGLAVLLNRVGRTATDTFGYDGNGLDITLNDSAANGDIHLYEMVSTPAPGNGLTGSWSPDARLTDPDQVVDTDPRMAFLSRFDGLNARGQWALFVADLSGGNLHQLNQWTLTIEGEAIPEPGSSVLLGLGGLSVLYRRRHRRSNGGELSRALEKT